MKRMPALTSFILFILLCSSLAYWVMQVWRPSVRPITVPVLIADNAPSLDAAFGLFGGRPVAASMASNYQLRGVVVDGNGTASVAIIAADGKPTQAVRVHTELQPGVVIQEVHPRYVMLSEHGVVKQIALPETQAANEQTNISPPAASSNGPPAMHLSATPDSANNNITAAGR
jgi:general secretion pathway protein C